MKVNLEHQGYFSKRDEMLALSGDRVYNPDFLGCILSLLSILGNWWTYFKENEY